MTRDSKAIYVRGQIIPAIDAYWKTRTEKEPHGCPNKLKVVVNIHDKLKKKLNGSMPSANKVGYADKRNALNDAMKFYGLKHS